jgi:hypothetical protein
MSFLNVKKCLPFVMGLAFAFGAGAQTAPVLTAPTNGAAGEAVTLNLTWGTVAGAASYSVELSTSSAFSSTVLSGTGLTAATYRATGLANSTTYYWQVNENNGTATSAWSTAWDFTTVAVAAPAAPTLAAPANAATGEATSLTLTWNASARATSYGAQVSTVSTFASTVLSETGITGLSAAVSGLADSTTYYWHVDASNAGATSAYSAVRSFTTVAAGALTAPVLATPTNGSTGQATALTLAWGTVAGATSYTLQVATGSTFTVLTENQAGITAGSIGITGLAAGTEYYWEVNAVNATITSVWSSAWHFTTGAALTAPAAPTLAAPANAATGEPASLTLTWNTAARATGYEAQVSLVSTFATTVFDEAGITALNAAVSGLASGTMYYWHVDASNAAGTSAYSAMRNFTTGIPAPTLTSPANGSTDLGKTVAFAWSSVSGAVTYTLQISTTQSFATTVLSSAGMTGTTMSLAGLSNKTIYFWEVQAVGATLTSAWSTSQDFEIDYTSVLSPVAAAAGVPTFEVRNGVIAYSLQRSGPVEIAVFDLRGRSVFAYNHTQPAGNFAIDLTNRSVAPGKYFVWFKSGVFEKRTAIAFTGSR